MKYINSKLKSKFGPFLLAGATVIFLLGALLLSGTYSQKVLAQTKPATTPATAPKTTTTTTPVVKNPTNLNTPTGENVDESGKSGFVICGNTADTPCNVTHLFRILIIIINYLISAVGLVAILFIVIAGIQMIISQGTLPTKEGNQSQLTSAKRRLAGAVTGLILVAVAFVLVNTLLAGSFNIGIKNGALILTNPKAYINQCTVDSQGNVDPSCQLPSQTTPLTKPVTQTQGTTPKPATTPGK